MIWLIVAASIVSLVIGGAIGSGMAARRRDQETRGGPNSADRASRLNADDPLARAVRALPLGIVIADGRGSVVFRNTFAEQFWNARHTNALVETAIDEVLAAAQVGRRIERELDLYGPPRRHLVLRAGPIVDDGEVPGVVVTIEDVTELRRVEEIRRDFVANVSHELKTPVGAIAVLAETLNAADDPAVVERLSERLEREAIRLGNTIDDLLTLSRIESGDVLIASDVPVVEVFRAAIERAATEAERRGVSLESDVDDPHLSICGDRLQLVSAVGNLIENGVKYSNSGAQVCVRGRRGEGVVELVVEDNGIGIPEADLDRIFERFYRVDNARSRETGGTGLGLSIVRHVMLNHEGTIEVESQEGTGTTFRISVPTGEVPTDGVPDSSPPKAIVTHG